MALAATRLTSQNIDNHAEIHPGWPIWPPVEAARRYMYVVGDSVGTTEADARINKNRYRKRATDPIETFGDLPRDERFRKHVVPSLFEAFRKRECQYHVDLSPEDRSLLFNDPSDAGPRSPLPFVSRTEAAAHLRFDVLLLLTLLGETPAVLFSTDGQESRQVIHRRMVYTCLAPLVEAYELDRYGFGLRLVSRHLAVQSDREITEHDSCWILVDERRVFGQPEQDDMAFEENTLRQMFFRECNEQDIVGDEEMVDFCTADLNAESPEDDPASNTTLVDTQSNAHGYISLERAIYHVAFCLPDVECGPVGYEVTYTDESEGFEVLRHFNEVPSSDSDPTSADAISPLPEPLRSSPPMPARHIPDVDVVRYTAHRSVNPTAIQEHFVRWQKVCAGSGTGVRLAMQIFDVVNEDYVTICLSEEEKKEDDDEEIDEKEKQGHEKEEEETS